MLRIGPVATAALALTIVLYASLLPLGKWQPDEFIQFHNLSIQGGRAVVDRVFAWSPRPVSELLLWAYGTIANRAGRPLIVPFLATLWALLVACPYVAARGTRDRPALVTFALVAAFLLLAKPGEMFYWPAAAAAYLVGITALAVASLARSARVVGAALLVAAWSDEIAATAVLVDAVLLLALRASPRLRPLLGWRMPLALGAAASFVVIVLLTHRMGTGFELAPQPGGTEGRLGASLAAAVPPFIRELIALPLSPVSYSIAAGLAVKLMLFLGFRPGAGEAARGVRAPVRGLAFLVAGGASLALAYRQFGFGCCERHATFRADLIVLALYSFAQAWPTRMAWPTRAVLLAVPLLGVLTWRLHDIRADRALIVPTIASRAANWEAGRSPGPSMTWANAPYPHLANGWLFDPGLYRRTSDTDPGALDWRYFAVMVFFGKEYIVVK